MTVEEMIDTVRNEYIEQIYALKSEVESKSKELEVYKKALKFACSGLGVGFCCKDDECDSDCVICWEEHLLNKAREEK